MKRHLDTTTILAGMIATPLLLAPPAQALPSFAAQTQQPCSACHVGGFGPQLTPFGRAFKIGGYTATGGGDDSADASILTQVANGPISAMVLSSFTNTNSAYPQGQQPQHYNTNNNVALDQISLFYGSRLTDWAGAFVQGTYTDISNQFHLDQVDLRPYTQLFNVKDNDVRVGVVVSNTPTVQDPWNTTYAWGYPYVASALAPVPAAQPLIAGGFANGSLGLTGYLWVNDSIYVEAGGYQTMSPWLLTRTGNIYGPGSTQGIAPYVRVAYEQQWSGQSAHIGALFMQANVNPTTADRASTNANGQDLYSDFAIDASYQFAGERDVISIYAIGAIEEQTLNGSAGAYNNSNGTAYGSTYRLNQTRLTGMYWYQNTYGVSLAWQRTWGTFDPVLYSAAPISGSANSKPNSNAFILEADWVPFGKPDSWGSPWANLKLGVQYTIYTQFNGGTTNYDGYGRNASANNTLYAFAWLMF